MFYRSGACFVPQNAGGLVWMCDAASKRNQSTVDVDAPCNSGGGKF